MAIYNGTTGNDTLDGTIGGNVNDTLNGNLGNDLYIYNLGSGNDVITDTGGSDTIQIDDPNNLFSGIWNWYRNGNDLIIDFDGEGRIAVTNQFLSAPVIEYITFPGWNTFSFSNGFTGGAGNDILIGTTAAESITGNAGDDEIFGNGGSDTLSGGDGNDEIYGGAGNDSISGGNGDDWIYGKSGADTIDGGTGYDAVSYIYESGGITANLSGAIQSGIASGTVLKPGGGTDVLTSIEQVHGTLYNDVFYGGNSLGPVEVSLDAGNNTFYVGGGTGSAWSNISYGEAPTRIIVNLSDASINVNGTIVSSKTATDGVDTDTFVLSGNRLSINGSDHDDYIRGQDNVSNFGFSGGAGNDTLVGGALSDSVSYSNNGDGAVFGVIVNLSAGGLTLGASQGVTGITSSVTVAANSARDQYGNTDTLVSIESAYGSDANDYMLGSSGANEFQGRGGNDTLLGGDGDDMLLGGEGADFLVGGGGNDFIDGGVITDRLNNTDYNTVSYAGATAGVNINLSGISGDGSSGFGTATGDVSVGTDTLTNINFVRGTSYNDTITGSSSALVIEVFEGGLGNDTIDGGAMVNTLDGSTNNRVTYQNATGAVSVNLATGSATGADGNDTLININQVRGSNYGDTLTGSDRTDLTEQFEGRAGNDVINGAGGYDIARYDGAPGTVNVNLATGVASDGYGTTDTLSNIEGVRGSNYADILTGGNVANDAFEFFQGMGGNDTIDGGSGFDRADYGSATAGVTVTLGGASNGIASGDASIGTDTLISIEGVRGSAFNDTLTGSNDTNIAETFQGSEGNDLINGGLGKDTAVFFGTKSGYSISPSGSTWTVTDTNLADGNEGTDTLTGIEFLKFSDGTRSLVKTAASDFNGDGKSDILWRNASSGADAIWNGADNGSGVPVGGVADLNWKVAGVGDFNGDGKSDILWRNASSGADAIWNGANSGDSLAVGGVADLNWKVAGVGDFNGDGKSDILWRNTSTGANGLWNGGNSGDSLPVGAVADLNWKVAGVGDFNGDGKDDILWRNTSTGYNAIWNGGDNSNGLPMGEVTDLNWKVEGVGDFNGDGKDDILWRNASTGYNAIWNGGDNSNGLPMGEVTDLAWKVAGTGDYNGDGKDDVLWRNASSGADAIWNGGDNSSSLPVGEVTDLNWQIPAQTNSWLTAAGDYPV